MQGEGDKSMKLTEFMNEGDLVVTAVREPIRAEQQCHVTQSVKVHVVSAYLSQPVQPCAACAVGYQCMWKGVINNVAAS